MTQQAHRVERHLGAAARWWVMLSICVGACATPPPLAQGERLQRLTEEAAAGSAEASMALAQQIAWQGTRVGTLRRAERLATVASTANIPGARALQARLREALGNTEEAFDDWLNVAEEQAASPIHRLFALHRLDGLVDAVPLRAGHAHRLLALARESGRVGSLAARLSVDVSRRLGDEALITRARRASGAVRHYRRSGRLNPLGARASRFEISTARPLMSAPIPTPDGTLAFADEGPGTYLATVVLPTRGAPRVVRIEGVETLVVRLDGRVLARFEGLRTLVPRVVRVRLPAGRAGELELWVGSRSPAPEVRVTLGGVGPGTMDPAETTPLERFALFEWAVSEGDLPLAESLEGSVLSQAPIAALANLRLRARNPAIGRAERPQHLRPLLREALGRAPGLWEARKALIQDLYQAGDDAEADALLRPVTMTAYRLRIDRAVDAGQEARARELARRWQAAVPTSCQAMDTLLGVDARRFRFRRDGWSDRVPRCLGTLLRTAQVLRSGWRNEAAHQVLLRALAIARPGAERAQTYVDLANLSASQGRLNEATQRANEGLKEGVHRSELLQTLERLHVLRGEEREAKAAGLALVNLPEVAESLRRRRLDPRRHLGLPLVDGLALARSALGRRGFRWPTGKSPSVNVLLRERHTAVLPGGRQIHREHHIAELLDDGALEAFGEISLPEGAQVLIARTYTPTGEGELQPVEAEDFPETSSISLAGLSVGATVEVAWIWETAPSPAHAPHWQMPNFTFDAPSGPVETSRCVLRTLGRGRLSTRFFGRKPEVKELEPGLTSYTLRGVSRARREPGDPRPKLHRNMMQASRGLGAEELGERWTDAFAENLRITPALRRFAEKTLRNATGGGARARLFALYDAVGKMMIDPSPGPADTWAARAMATGVGDPSLVLTALCGAVGLHCNLVMLEPRYLADPTRHELLSPERFVYPVVRARLGGETLWMAPNNRFTPFGYLPPLLRGAAGLVLGGKETEIIRTPDATGNDGAQRIECEGSVAASGDVSLGCREELTGLFAMGMRRRLSALDEQGRRKHVEGLARGLLSGANVTQWRFEGDQKGGAANNEAPLVVHWRAESKLYGLQSGGKRLQIGLRPSHLGRRTAQLHRRQAPLFNLETAHMHLQITLRLADSLSVTLPPGEELVAHDLVQLERRVSWDGRKHRLVIEKRFDLVADRILAQDYARWTQAARRIDAIDRIELHLHASGQEAAP